MIFYAKHRTASGDLMQMWEYVHADRRVHVTLKQGRVVIDFSVAVCSAERPRVGAHPIQRRDIDTWQIVPLRYICVWKHRIEHIEPIKCSLAAEHLSAGCSLKISHAPPSVCAELEAL